MKIQFPDVFYPLTSPARFKGAWGGRGSGKSHFFGGHLVLQALERNVRAVCLREVQMSIKDSVKQLIEDKIREYGHQSDFRILDQEIRGPNDSLFIFRGLKDMNAASIKSLEGFNVAWVEEAQTLTQKSLDLLIPTIREDDSELWFSWNPDNPTDPVDVFLRKRKPPNAQVVRANYEDNPFFPDVLRLDMERDKAEDYAKYAHVWLGEYRDVSDTQFISREIIRDAVSRETELPEGPRIMGFDPARFGDDRSVLVSRHGHKLNKIWRWTKKDSMQLASIVSDVVQQERPQHLFVDSDGLGGPIADRLKQLIDKEITTVVQVYNGSRAARATRYRNKRAEMWSRMKDWLRDVGDIPDDDELSIDLQSPNYEYDVQNRLQLEKKEDMKKRGLLSPDCADALALTFAENVAPRHEVAFIAARNKAGGSQAAYDPLSEF